MNVHYLMHVPFEGLGSMESWFVSQGHALSRTRLFAGEPLPHVDALDWLMVMGGPMGVGDEQIYPWLRAEQAFIERALQRDIPVLGICLGAQLLASVLGAAVTPNREREIGWFPTRLTPQGRELAVLAGLPREFTAFHWHGDRFDVPSGAIRVATSEVCDNQAFVYRQAVALQFHLETQPSNAMDLCAHCGDDLVSAPYVQSAQTMLEEPRRFTRIQALMCRLLENMAALADRG
jgi:GMP synthase (glutamine-hydrolysing)